MKIYKIANVKLDSEGERINLRDEYTLKLKWEYIKSLEDPYFLGGGTFHAPEMVFMPDEAALFTGHKLLNLAWPWYEKWSAIKKR